MVVFKLPFMGKPFEPTWTYPHSEPSNIAACLNSRECNGVARRGRAQRIRTHRNSLEADMARYVSRKLAGSLTDEHEFDTAGLDKVFAATWLSDDHVVMGTKCNALVVLNVGNGKRVQIPLVEAHVPGWGSEQAVGEKGLMQRQVLPDLGTGIRCMAVNPSRTLIAVGVGRPLGSIEIFKLPSFEPLAVLQGHTDMVFSVAWMSDNVLVSGARDMTVKKWMICSESGTEFLSPLNGPRISLLSATVSACEHRGKVRDMLYNTAKSNIATLSTDGFVKIWDANKFKPSTNVPLRYTEETCCLAFDDSEHIYAIGSANHVSLVDPRAGQVVHTFESCDDGWGVRSLAFDNAVLAVGGGKGRVSFYDMRGGKYLAWPSSHRSQSALSTPSSPSPLSRSASSPLSPGYARRSRIRRGSTAILAGIPSDMTAWLQTGEGWLLRDAMYEAHFQGADVRNAIYTLKYNPSRSGLFAAGGPLQLNLKGSFAGMW
ncbi:uncharacterized protein SPPG_07019 [Spizellomyces punctatus DAOM BR117]|uniref:DDB1- and CUL4-associated factor 12 beta-propeller domain-containing protein n=1 Tax=Spizellomyces punctatus (strain DAOM BR117) TaxID=645134 RepID=A0A0L0HA47_SPIPD|nr:uncharacterized protein SPPG_07019 [Spizellomyces punctatus DAOM BR117]KNC97543.1 hypothetical protein SPPG_07019 [Spizellomyces punctatus DAOM BR117]|eukprot:XP_016605583.1 hypothetical protein SPPG_07019 [Spizellomyces punctatus DAOM BR117]